MVGRTILGFDGGEYLGLVEQFPPVNIRTAEQAKATESRIEELLAQPKLSEAEEAYVDLLSDLLADWEDATVKIPDIDGVELLRLARGSRFAPEGPGRGLCDRVSCLRGHCWSARAVPQAHRRTGPILQNLSRRLLPGQERFDSRAAENNALRRAASRAKGASLDTRRKSETVRGQKKPGR